MPFSEAELQHLIARLAVGADQRLFSVMDWEAQLGGDPAAKEFARQLRLEWQPAIPPDDFCREMVDFVRDHLHMHDHGPHIWAHTLRVTGNAMSMAHEANVEPQLAFLLALFHDVGKLDEIIRNETHEAIGAEIARHKLSGIFSRSMVTLISNVIGKDASRANPFTRLLHDADKLDKIGAAGIARRFSAGRSVGHTEFALRRLRSELISFRPMYFPFAQVMAEMKKQFTREFLASLHED
ncbi:MAG: HDIG domain-containing protein [Anaerolineae bacterium]|nr:HDIG domain-containing protein [Anaerolineae bacterium]